MPDVIPNTTPNTAPKPGVPTTQVAPKDAPITDPNAKKVDQAAPVNAAQSVNPEKAAVNQGQDAIRKLKLKIDGREEELPEHEVIARAQKSSAADKRFAEAQQARAQAEQFIHLLKTDLPKLLDDPRLGIDEKEKREMLEKYYKAKYIDPEVLTPEQRKQQAEQEELNRYREGEKTKKQKEHQEKLDQLEAYHAENYQKIMITALQTEGLPRTDFTARRMADLMMKNHQLGLELTPEHLATLVKEDYLEEQRALYSATDGDTLLKLMGDDIVNKIRKADLARLRSGIPNVPSPTVETPKTNAPQNARKPMSMDQMKEERDRKVRELQATWKK